ncbi:MAG: LysM peptidoglycan-binding domain-containing protein [Prolixibacteraceae bacterium]
MKRIFLIAAFFLTFTAGSHGQAGRLTASGLPSLQHHVRPGETIFSISKKYAIEQNDLLAANPQLAAGLKAGADLIIPVSGGIGGSLSVQGRMVSNQEPLSGKQERMPAFEEYKVKRDDSIYFIARRFGIEVEDILKYNPEVRNGLEKRQILRIPDKDDLAAIKAEAGKKEAESAKALQNRKESRPSEFSDEFFIYVIPTGETFWNLEKKYQMTRRELEALNPELKAGLKTGTEIRIPLEKVPDIQVTPVEAQNFERHTVLKGETLYTLSKRFGVRVNELKRVNPVLNYRGLVAGESILVPKIQAEAVRVQEPVREVQEAVQPDYSVQIRHDDAVQQCRPDRQAALQTYQVGLFLPLYLPANDTVNRVRVSLDEMMRDSLLMERLGSISNLPVDSFRTREQPVVYPRSENFLHFYEGFLLAADSLRRAGMHVQIRVFDTNQKRYVVDSLVNSGSLRDLDLIIGPTFPELQKSISDFALRNRIPLVSPLSSSGDFEEKNPWFFKVNPTKPYLIEKTADYIVDEYFDKNVIVLRMGEYSHLPEAQLIKMIREKLLLSGYRDRLNHVLFHEYRLSSGGAEGLKKLLSKDRENVFIIPSETEAQISVAVTTLNAMAEEFPVTLIGLSNYQRYRSVQTEYFHRIKLSYLTPYFVDYKSPFVNQFIRKFRHNYAGEPNQYGFQGYDVAFYFMSALFQYGKDFTDCLPMLKVSLTQSDLAFDKVSREGGYMNRGLFIIQYEPGYDIVMKGLIGIPPHVTAEN